VERIRSRGAVHRLFTAFTVEARCPNRNEGSGALRRQRKGVGEITSSAICLWPAEIVRSVGYLRREGAGGICARDGEGEGSRAAARLNSDKS